MLSPRRNDSKFSFQCLQNLSVKQLYCFYDYPAKGIGRLHIIVRTASVSRFSSIIGQRTIRREPSAERVDICEDGDTRLEMQCIDSRGFLNFIC